MSTIDDVITKYTEAKEREDAERVAARRERENVFLETFLQLRREWLGDLMEVFTPADAVYNRDRDSETATCVIFFEEMTGKLTYLVEGERRAYARIEFDLPAKYSDRSYDLELKRANGVLIAPTVEGWGEYLLNLRAAKIESDKIVAEKIADERQYRINDLTSTLRAVHDREFFDALMEKARAEAPDFNWQPVFEAASAHLEKYLAAVRENDALQQEINTLRLAEIEQDKVEARRRWFKFRYFEIRFSDGMSHDENDTGVFSAYVAHQKPDADGWYKTFYRGQIQRQQFPHIVSITEVDVISPGDDNDYSGICAVQKQNGITIKTPPAEAEKLEGDERQIVFGWEKEESRNDLPESDLSESSSDETPF